MDAESGFHPSYGGSWLRASAVVLTPHTVNLEQTDLSTMNTQLAVSAETADAAGTGSRSAIADCVAGCRPLPAPTKRAPRSESTVSDIARRPSEDEDRDATTPSV